MSIQQIQQCFNKSQQCSTFVDQQKLNDVEPCIIRLTGVEIGDSKSLMGKPNGEFEVTEFELAHNV